MGTYQAFLADANKPTGAFYEAGQYPKNHQGTVAGTDVTIGFNASLSNPIYGNSTTVTPLSLQNKFFLKF